MRRPCGLFLIVVLGPAVVAQEQKLNLSGLFHLGSTRTRVVSRFTDGPRIENRATTMDWGLDLNVRTYILDPRFIRLSLELSFFRGSGRIDDTETRQSATGGSFYLDLLSTSHYPFRFHFIDQDSSYLQGRLSSAETARRSVGFDWALKKPKVPPLFIRYDSSRYDHEFFPRTTFESRAKSFFMGTRGSYRGWDTRVNYDRQSAIEPFTQLGTALDALRGDVRRELRPDSILSVNGLYQNVRFSNERTGWRQDLPFFHVRTDLNTKHSEKLSSQFFHQYYRAGLGTNGFGREAGAAAAAVFNQLGAQVSYRPLPSITLGQSTDAAFLRAFDPVVESATGFVNLSATASWQKKIKAVMARAGYLRGLSYARSNLGDSRPISFDGHNAGFDVGEKRYALFSADYGGTRRPDLFEIGGRFSQRYGRAAVETAAPRLFELRASAGLSHTEYLTSRGRERFRTWSYSASLLHRIFTVQASRNINIGLRNLLLAPLPIEPGRLFRTLPVEVLVRAPFSRSSGVYTLGSVGVRPHRSIELDFRYFRQRLLFPTTPSVLLNNYEALASYRVGRFVISAWAAYYRENTELPSVRRRGSFFFRVSRRFTVI